MNFSKTTSYSINVLSYMAQHENDVFSARMLHDKLGIPYSYLRSVLGKQSKSGILKTVKGRNGGFKINCDKSKLYLSDIIEVTESLESLNKCLLGFGKCPFNLTCFMHKTWEKMRNEILEILKNTSLAEVLPHGETNHRD